MDFNTIKSYFTIRTDNGTRAQAICPVHNDKQASLSISYNADNQKTVLYCHAGCETRDILDAVGLRMTDIFDRPLDESTKQQSNIEKIYQYRDESGNVLFEKIRFRPKGFSHRRIVGGKILWSLDGGIFYETFNGSNEYSLKERKGVRTIEAEGIEPILYNLPAIIRAIESEEIIYVVEGEKDVENLSKLNLTATCNFDGASTSTQKPKWKERYNATFKGAKVAIIPDNDNPGHAHALNIAKNLKGIAESIKIINLSGLEEKEDISDWFETGHTAETLQFIVRHAEEWDPDLQPENVDLIRFNFSDVGNTERLLAAYGKIIRYCPGWKNPWLIWSGKHWKIDHENKIEGLARATLRELQKQGNEILESEETKKLKENIHKFVLKSESDNRIKAMINQAKSQPSIIVKRLNGNEYLLNYKNGTLNLKTGELQPHNRRDHITRLIDLEYKKDMKCPNWESFINKIFLGNKELIEYVQRSVGYSMTGNATMQCFYILHGGGSNGKGTFMKTIMAVLGDYSGTLKGTSLMEKNNDEGARGDLAKLESKRFVLVNELEDNKSLDEALVKSLSSGSDEVVPVRRMYEEEFDLKPTFKMWMTTNKLPKIKGTDQGIWRRVRKVPFEYDFETDPDKDEDFFVNKLIAELPGIVNWALEGCLKWQREGIQVPEIVSYAINDYRHDMDTIQRFIDECCIVSETVKVNKVNMYDLYCEWCKENKEYTLSTIKFNKKLTEKGFNIATVHGKLFWKNIGIVESEYSEIKTDGNIFPF